MKVKKKMHTTQLLMAAYNLALQVVGAVIIAVDDQAAPSPAPALTPKQLTLPGCPSTCGGVEIPYPFGIGNSSTPGDNKKPCYLEDRFNHTCIDDSILYVGSTQISHIDILRGQMDVLFGVSSTCNNSDQPYPSLSFGWLSISNKKNKFITIGCNSYGYLRSHYNGDTYVTGCITKCFGHVTLVDDGRCSGIGCCQVDIPPRMRNISIEAYNFTSSVNDKPLLGESCTYAFVVKQDNYVFSPNHLQQGGLPRQEYPMVIDWALGLVENQRCSAATQSEITCGKNSHCNDTDTDIGYRCICDPGYDPTIPSPDGCTDTDECERGNHTCISRENCINTNGSHTCFCPKGQSGDGTKKGGCHPRVVLTKVVIGAGIGVIVLFVGTTSLFLMYQKRKLIQMKEKFFQQNDGFILKQQLSKRRDSSQTAQIFTEGQLKKATNNYDESLIIGKGGFGTV